MERTFPHKLTFSAYSQLVERKYLHKLTMSGLKSACRTEVSPQADNAFKNYQPDTEPKEITSVPGELQKHSENTYLSRYVWLPIDWVGDKSVIRWHKEWKLE